MIAFISGKVAEEDTPLTFSFSLGDVDTAVESITVSGVSSNTGLLPNSGISFSGSGPTRDITLSPAANQSGSTIVTLTANDGVLNSAPRSFTLMVNMNSGATDIALTASTVPENSAENTEIGIFSVTDPNSTDTHTLSLSDNAGGRFKIVGSQLQVADGGLLNFESSQSHSIIVTATDNGGLPFSKQMAISLSNVNEAPAVIMPASLADAETGIDQPLPGISLSDPDALDGDVTVSFTVSNGILILQPVGSPGAITNNSTGSVSVTATMAEINTVLGGGGLVYRSAANFEGNEVIFVAINDNGNTGSGSPLSADGIQSFTVVDDPYQQWRRTHFNTAQLADNAISGALADPDKDGRWNLMEYGTGTNPNKADASDEGVSSQWVFVGGGEQVLEVSYKRRKNSTDPLLEVTAEIGSDLDPNEFSSAPEDIAIVATISIDSEFETVVARSVKKKSEAARQFVRLKFVRQEAS